MISLMTARQFGIESYASTAPVELRSNASQGDIEAVILAAYRQVFGNEHLMQFERLISAESLLRKGLFSLSDFIRAIAMSETYRTKFLYENHQIRFIELNFKHLLGRAPADQAEISYHVNLLMEKGYGAEINSYLDSNEYQDNFGQWIVPYPRGFGVSSVKKQCRVFALSK